MRVSTRTAHAIKHSVQRLGIFIGAEKEFFLNQNSKKKNSKKNINALCECGADWITDTYDCF